MPTLSDYQDKCFQKKYIDRLWRGVSKENMRHQRAWLSSLRALAMKRLQACVCQLDAEPPQSLSICKPGNFGLQAFFHKKQKQHRAPNPLNPQLLEPWRWNTGQAGVKSANVFWSQRSLPKNTKNTQSDLFYQESGPPWGLCCIWHFWKDF